MAKLATLCALGCFLALVSPSLAGKKVVSYFTNWAQYHQATLDGHSCRFTPAEINPSYMTHMNYAFAYFDDSFNMITVEWDDEQFYQQFNALKRAGQKTLISVGGWNFNNKDATKHRYSNMVSTQANRAHFIASAIAWARKYGFDGVDIDWEYPAWADQGGVPADTPNFSLFLKEFRAAIEAEAVQTNQEPLLLTMAAPAGEEKIKLIEFSKVHPYLDWASLMTYDLHGAWDKTVQPHTALKSNDDLNIDHAVSLYLKAGVPAEKIVVGLACYGRTWTLTDQSVHSYGAPATGAGNAGLCTQEAGYLNYLEIKHIINNGGKAVLDNATSTEYAYQGNQFVTYDNPDSHAIKTNYICDKGLGGAMMWAMDNDVDWELHKQIYNKVSKC